MPIITDYAECTSLSSTARRGAGLLLQDQDDKSKEAEEYELLALPNIADSSLSPTARRGARSLLEDQDQKSKEAEEYELLAPPYITDSSLSPTARRGAGSLIEDQDDNDDKLKETAEYEFLALPTDAVKGKYISIITYGQTGAAQTYTIKGPNILKIDELKKWLLPRVVDELYPCPMSSDEAAINTIKLSKVEGVMERIRKGSILLPGVTEVMLLDLAGAVESLMIFRTSDFVYIFTVQQESTLNKRSGNVMLVHMGGASSSHVSTSSPHFEQKSSETSFPNDIIQVIFEILGFKSRTRLQSVSKFWHLRPEDIIDLPFLLDINVFTDETTLICPYEKAGKQGYILKSFPVQLREIEGTSHGWVLSCGYPDRRSYYYRIVYAPSLFNPFTGEHMQLPDLSVRGNVDPRSSIYIDQHNRLVCFFAWIDNDDMYMGIGKIGIAACHAGETSWKYFNFDWKVNYHRHLEGVTIVEGKLYCLTEGFEVGVFSMLDNEFRWLCGLELDPPERCSTDAIKGFFGKGKEELFWFECKLEEDSICFPQVKRFDLVDGCWTDIGLEDKIMFMSRGYGGFMFSAFEKGQAELAGMAFAGEAYAVEGGAEREGGAWNYAAFYAWMNENSYCCDGVWIDPNNVLSKSAIVVASD